MAFHLWWQNHDGIRGHAFLTNDQMAAIRRELLAQGMVCGAEGGRGIPLAKFEVPRNEYVSPIELDEALEAAATEPRVLADERLWHDFLAFLEGAARHGGLRVKP
jgi:hypothetical protein